jgi:hypothetical protein
MISEKNIKPVEVSCNSCKYFHRNVSGGFTCKAFPEGIPWVIMVGAEDHKEVFLNQRNKIVYQKE